MLDYQPLFDVVVEGNPRAVEAEVRRSLEAGAPAADILSQGLIPAMTEVGRKFECQEFYVPDMLMAARAMQSALKLLRPLLAEGGAQPRGRVAIGTVKGDLHDIGKSLVSMMLEGAGFEIRDLGVDVSPEGFIEAIEAGADLVAMSALLTTTMPNLETTIQAIRAAGVRHQARIMVGGAPVTQAYADQIGADGYAPDAAAAARRACQLMELTLK